MAVGVAVFAVSKFDADYRFVKDVEFQTAVAALRKPVIGSWRGLP
jgi:hypothetical protein